MRVLLANYGDESIAALQWLSEQATATSDLVILSVDTGWAAPEWATRVKKARAFAEGLGFRTEHLPAQLSFTRLVQEKQAFPTQKFQWCAGFLKGLAQMAWLDEHDPTCEATVLLAKRQTSSLANAGLQAHVEASEPHGDRALWYPILSVNQSDRDALIQRAGFTPLNHRSLECDPCVNNTTADFTRLDATCIARVASLEAEIGEPMFPPDYHGGATTIEAVIHWVSKLPSTDTDETELAFSMGCGEPYGCGE